MKNSSLRSNYRKIPIDYRSVFEKHHVSGPICHAGALINKEVTEDNVQSYRDGFRWMDDSEYVGIDLFSGPNVDIQADLCSEDFSGEHGDLNEYFGVVICRALLEHVENPFKAAKNISWMIRPGGHLYINNPWVWGYHPYPDDYWRISFSAVKVLFPEFTWLSKWYHSTKSGETGLEFSEQRYERKVFLKLDPGTEADSQDLFDLSDRLMPYLNIGAIGVKEK